MNILHAIRYAQRTFGTDNLSGGNCGTFALALARLSAEAGKQSTFGILFRDVAGVETIRELLDAETDIYHIVLEVGNRKYDGTGETTVDQMLDLAETQYGDFNPGYFSEVAMSKDFMRLVRNDTDWSIQAPTFYKAMFSRRRR